MPSWTASVVNIASTAPARAEAVAGRALRARRPAIRRAFSSPSASLITRVSLESPIGVDVACALM